MAKRKQIGRGDMTGDKGIALIHRIVNDMDFVWNALHLEAGIDGIIEIRDSVTAEVSNCIIQVQSKAGQSYFKAETDSEFEFLCDERDLDYWMRGNAPVILVVSRPEADEAYWISIKDYFRDPKVRKTRKIRFSKSRDHFTRECRQRLASLALPADSGHYLTAIPQPDTLFSNLLPVVDYPRRLFRASTKVRDPAIVWDELNRLPDLAKPEWLLHDGYIYAFHDLTFSPWEHVCTASTAQNLATNDFANSDDPNRRYVFLRMVGTCLEQILYRQGVRYCKHERHHYFRSTSELTERKVGGLSVFKGYPSKTTPNRIAYYRHRAAELGFVRFDCRWYVEINPTYRFTQDGWKRSKFAEQRLRGIKQQERQNKTHLRQVRLWEEVLRQTHLWQAASQVKQRELFDEGPELEAPATPYPLLTFDPLMSFNVDWNVPESVWLPQPSESEEDDVVTGQRSLFD